MSEVKVSLNSFFYVSFDIFFSIFLLLLMESSNILERYLAGLLMPVRKPDGCFRGMASVRVTVVCVFEWTGLLLNVVKVTFTFNVHRQIIMKAQ